MNRSNRLRAIRPIDLVALLSLTLAMILPVPVRVFSPFSGIVCVQDQFQSGGFGPPNACSYGIPDLAGPPTNQTVSPPQVSTTQIRVGVYVEGSDSLNAFDVILLANSSVLKPFAADLLGSIFSLGTTTVRVRCIGGSGIGCSSVDTRDTIEFSVASNPAISAPVGGLLFRATYNITGETSSSRISIGFQTGCQGTSVSGGVCVTISNGSATPNSESVQNGIFTNANPMQWVSVSASQPVLGPVFPGATATTTLTYTPQDGWPSQQQFNCPCQMEMSTDKSSSALNVGWSPSPTVNITGSQPVTLTISMGLGLPYGAGNYTVTIYGEHEAFVANTTLVSAYGRLVVPITLTLRVWDYSLGPANGMTTTFNSGQKGSSNIALTSANGFNGNVEVSTRVICISTTNPAVCPGAGLSVTYNGAQVTTVSLSPGAIVIIRMNLTSSSPNRYTLLPEGVYGSYTKLSDPGFIVLVQDFNITDPGSVPSASAGTAGSFTLTISSLPSSTAYGFTGTISLNSTSSSPALFVVGCSPSTASLSAGGTLSAICSFESNTVGVYQLGITASGTGAGGNVAHSKLVTVDVVAMASGGGGRTPNPT